MFLDMLLIMRAEEARNFSALFLKHNPNLIIKNANNKQELVDFEPFINAQTRLITFSTFILVPAFILQKCNFNAYNFHPGPAQYPGFDPIGMARYCQNNHYGVVLHETMAKVDSGAIISEMVFTINPRETRNNISVEAYKNSCKMVHTYANLLAQTTTPLIKSDIKWNERFRTSRAFVRHMQEKMASLSELEYMRRQFAFGDCNPDAGLELNML